MMNCLRQYARHNRRHRVPEEEADKANQTENPVCSPEDAKVHIQDVRCYLATCSHTSNIVSALESSLLQTIAQKQKSIRDFFY